MAFKGKRRLSQSRTGKILRIGTRGSLLALAQANGIMERLKKKFPRVSFQLAVVKTHGDEFQGVELFKQNGIGVFTKTIEQALLKKEVDVAVHSLKDLPTDLPKGLCLAAFPRRLDPGDVLISGHRYTLKTLPKHATVATGSPRRKRQLEFARPDLKLSDIRGNLDTRVQKVLREKKYDAVVVAKAGLLRLKKYLRYASPISTAKLMPAVGQAALGIEARRNDREILRMLRTLNHAETEVKVRAERSFLKTLGGGCRVPVGIRSVLKKRAIHLEASVFSTRSATYLHDRITGPASRSDRLAKLLARKLLKKGAAKFLKEARR